MSNQPCKDCSDLLNKTTNKRHSNLRRVGLSKSVGYHGSHDDENYYTCSKCGTKFIGDGCGTWKA